MKARHIALVALSAVAATTGSAFAADDGVIRSRTFLEFQQRYWNGSDIPANLVRQDKPVLTAQAGRSEFGRDGTVAVEGAAPLKTAAAADIQRLGRDVPVATVRGKAPVTATPSAGQRGGRG